MATANDHGTTVSDLVESLRRAHRLCDTTGDNLPELIRTALEQLAKERGSTGQLVGFRPGPVSVLQLRVNGGYRSVTSRKA
jgi:hypothetical protein